jgi:hypothetical protein
MQNILAVECFDEVDDFAGEAQLDRRERFHFAHLERD